ncbi:MAG: prefoldin subunit alpha [Candidatus Woesearchaeota archaeon]
MTSENNQSDSSSWNDKYLELEMVNQRLQELNNALQQIDNEIEHANVALATLDELRKGEREKELLIPLGSETFLAVQADDVKNVRQSVGAGIVVDKSIDDAINRLEKQLSETRDQREQYVQVYDEVVKKAEKLQEEIENEISKQRV